MSSTYWTLAATLTVLPLPVHAAQEVAGQLLKLLANPEGLVGDIDIDAEALEARLDRLRVS
jgi:hypothetical protein